jgi:hypothetical protein
MAAVPSLDSVSRDASDFNSLLTNKLLKGTLGGVHEGPDDQSAAAQEQWARDRLTTRGGGALPRLPWLADGQPHDAVTLIRQALWRANTDRAALDIPADLLAAIALLAAARAEVDQLEAGLLFVARAEGLTWAEIARPLGLRTAQAAQQRHERVLTRLDGDSAPPDEGSDPLDRGSGPLDGSTDPPDRGSGPLDRGSGPLDGGARP